MNSDELLAQIDDFVEKKLPMSPQWWIEQAQKLVVLMSDETDYLHQLQKEVAQDKVKWIDLGKSVAESKLRAEASALYEAMLKQKSKCEKITEIIRIAKIQAKFRENEWQSGGL